MGLEHVVVTSVCRDDLPDGGASVFAETIRRCAAPARAWAWRCSSPTSTADGPAHGHGGRAGHPQPQRRDGRATPEAGAQASALRPLARCARRWPRPGARASPGGPGTVHTKSSIMVGLGETREELSQTFRDLRDVDCDILTLGQYLRPTVGPPAHRALRPSRRVRRDEGGGPRPRLQARRVGPVGALLLPRAGPGARGGQAQPHARGRRPRRQRAGHQRLAPGSDRGARDRRRIWLGCRACSTRSYEAAGPHLREVITPERRLSAERLVRRLQGMCLLVLATVTADGRPINGPVDGFFYRGDGTSARPTLAPLPAHPPRPQVSATHMPRRGTVRSRPTAELSRSTSPRHEAWLPPDAAGRTTCIASARVAKTSSTAGVAYARIDGRAHVHVPPRRRRSGRVPFVTGPSGSTGR